MGQLHQPPCIAQKARRGRGGVQGVGGAVTVAGCGGGLTKVVLARRSEVLFRGELDPLALLAALQVRRTRPSIEDLHVQDSQDHIEGICRSLLTVLQVAQCSIDLTHLLSTGLFQGLLDSSSR